MIEPPGSEAILVEGVANVLRKAGKKDPPGWKVASCNYFPGAWAKSTGAKKNIKRTRLLSAWT